MSTIHELLGELNALEASSEAAGQVLRMDLADLILKALKERGWSQKQLAQAVGKKESYVTRVIHSGSNCTFASAGHILHALGIEAHLVAGQHHQGAFAGNVGWNDAEIIIKGMTHVAEAIKFQGEIRSSISSKKAATG